MSLRTMLESYCYIQRPTTVTRNSQQGVVQNFVTILENLACSQQEASTNTQEIYAQRNTAVTTTLYFDQDPGAEPNDIVVVTDRAGTINKFLVRGTSQPVGRARIWYVNCERIKQPTVSYAP